MAYYRLSTREQKLYDCINRLSKDGTVFISTISIASKMSGRSFSGVISSLVRKGLIKTDGFEIRLIS